MKTPFLWSGSKDKDFQKIRSYITEFKEYHEPFCGSGSIYFRLLAEKKTSFIGFLTDTNFDLINAFNVIKNHPNELISKLPKIKDKEIYINFKKNIPTNDIDNATKFLYLNRNSFFGLGGWMNADRYAYNSVIERIKYFSPLMKNTEFSNKGCYNFIPNKNSFLFIDPPYPNTNNNACYRIDNNIMELNQNYIKWLLSFESKFLFIVKYNELLETIFKNNHIKTRKYEWSFRKPGKSIHYDYELYAYNSDKFFD